MRWPPRLNQGYCGLVVPTDSGLELPTGAMASPWCLAQPPHLKTLNQGGL